MKGKTDGWALRLPELKLRCWGTHTERNGPGAATQGVCPGPRREDSARDCLQVYDRVVYFAVVRFTTRSPRLPAQ